MAGVRFLIAGSLVYAWSRFALGGGPPTRAHWRSASGIGALLILGGNGLVVWAEQWVPSGLAALLVGMVPIWMVLADWLWGAGRSPSLGLFAGLLWGLLGVALLTSDAGFAARGAAGLIGGLAVVLAAMSTAVGSIWAQRVALPFRALQVSGMQMLWGGVWLLVAAALSGELARLGSVRPSAASLAAVVYLIVFGSLIAFSAYVWLLRASTPARISTYAYVNPVIALLLGWLLADEPISARTVLAAVIILSAVVLITRQEA